MNLCSKRHEEVCFEEGRYCPVCELRDELMARIGELESQLEAKA